MGVEQRSGGLRLDRIFSWPGHRPVQGPTLAQSVQDPSQEGEERRPRRREGREFFDLGGTIKEADLGKNSKDVEAVRTLYVQPSAIEHFSTREDEDPNTTTSADIRDYYRKTPRAKLLVAELDGKIVGAITIAPEEGINSVKLNRLVRREDKPGLGIAHLLIREAVTRSFSKKAKGGYRASSITIGVILGIKGTDAAREAFKALEFKTWDEEGNRCYGWSKEEGRVVDRKVEIMKLKREAYAFRGHGMDLHRGTSLPPKEDKSIPA